MYAYIIADDRPQGEPAPNPDFRTRINMANQILHFVVFCHIFLGYFMNNLDYFKNRTTNARCLGLLLCASSILSTNIL